MMFRALIVVLFVFLLGVSAVPTKLVYPLNEQFNYALNGNLDSRGQLVDGSRTAGATSKMTGVVVMEATDYKDGEYLFVLNAYGVTVSVDDGPAQSATGGANDDWLGDDMYFSQKEDGEITQIWYQKGDSQYFVEVKAGAINSFQTKIVAPGQKVQGTESDCVGTHSATFVGADQQTDLKVTKTFSEKDFTSFPDKNLKPSMMKMAATTSTSVHASGYVMGSSVEQHVVMQKMVPNVARSVNGDTTGFDMDMSSHGVLGITLLTSNVGLRVRSQRSHTFATLKSAVPTGDFVSSSLSDIGSVGVSLAKSQVPVMDAKEALYNAVTGSPSIKDLQRLAMYFSAQSSEVETLMAPWLEGLKDLQDDEANKHVRVLFFILASVGTEEAQSSIIRHGLNSERRDVLFSAVLYSAAVPLPSIDLASSLLRIGRDDAADSDVRRAAVLAFGAVLAKSEDNDLISSGEKILRGALKDALDADDSDLVVLLLHAIGNAGPRVISLEKLRHILRPHDVMKAHHDHIHQHWRLERVRYAFVHGIRKFDGAEVLDVYRRFLERDPSPDIRKYVAGRIAIITGESVDAILAEVPRLYGGDFPFNVSYDKEIKWGGSEVNARFDVDLFLGTNFDCEQEFFNYKGLAQAECTLTAFTEEKSAFLAKAVYGKDHGASVGNEIYLRVWNDVLYDKQIPQLDCAEHTYPLAHTAPGFKVSYTLWVSIIPITFSAGATLDLDLKWGWEICDSTLGAMVELIPGATLVVYGQAEINLLLLKAGLQLDVKMNTEIRPQGWIHGSECELGVDVRRTSTPMSADFESYFAWKTCKFLIFDCHWGTQHTHVWWSWSEPSHDDILWQKTWKIHK